MTRDQLLNISCVTIALRRIDPGQLTAYDLSYLTQLNESLQSVLYRRYGEQKYKLICYMARKEGKDI